jgi:prophage maintenance system killer protein
MTLSAKVIMNHYFSDIAKNRRYGLGVGTIWMKVDDSFFFLLQDLAENQFPEQAQQDTEKAHTRITDNVVPA